jgi:hypothetical protein
MHCSDVGRINCCCGLGITTPTNFLDAQSYARVFHCVLIPQPREFVSEGVQDRYNTILNALKGLQWQYDACWYSWGDNLCHGGLISANRWGLLRAVEEQNYEQG